MSTLHKAIGNVLGMAQAYNLWQKMAGAADAKREIVQRFVKPQAHTALLDLGCGTGELLDYISVPVAYTGIDINLDYINFARARYGARAKFICKGFDEKIELDSHFDLAVALGIVHHLDSDQANALFRLAAAKLRPSGKLILIEPVTSPEQSRIERLLMALDRGKHIRSASEYKNAAAAAFGTVESESVLGLYRIPWSLLVISCSHPVQENYARAQHHSLEPASISNFR